MIEKRLASSRDERRAEASMSAWTEKADTTPPARDLRRWQDGPAGFFAGNGADADAEQVAFLRPADGTFTWLNHKTTRI